MKKGLFIILNIVLLFVFVIFDYVYNSNILQFVESHWGDGRGIVATYNILSTTIQVRGIGSGFILGTIIFNVPLLCVVAIVLLNILAMRRERSKMNSS